MVLRAPRWVIRSATSMATRWSSKRPLRKGCSQSVRRTARPADEGIASLGGVHHHRAHSLRCGPAAARRRVRHERPRVLHATVPTELARARTVRTQDRTVQLLARGRHRHAAEVACWLKPSRAFHITVRRETPGEKTGGLVEIDFCDEHAFLSVSQVRLALP